MGVEYSRYLVPSPPTFAPSSHVVVKLIESLTLNRWLPMADSPCLQSVRHMTPDDNPKAFHSPGTSFPWTLLPWVKKRPSYPTFVQLPKYANSPSVDVSFVQQQLDGGGLLLEYSVSNLDRDEIKYPLARLDYDRAEAYFDFKLWLSPDYVYLTSETLEGFDDLTCQCGLYLAHERPNDVFSPHEHFPLQCPQCRAPFVPQSHQFHIRCGFTGDESTVPGGTVFRFAIEMDCGKCMPTSPVEFASDFRILCSDVLKCDFIELGNVN